MGCEMDWYMWLNPAAWMDDNRLLWPPTPPPTPPPPPGAFDEATAGGLTDADDDDSAAGVPFCWSSPPPPPPPLRWFLNFSSRRHFARLLLNQTCEEKIRFGISVRDLLCVCLGVQWISGRKKNEKKKCNDLSISIRLMCALHRANTIWQ